MPKLKDTLKITKGITAIIGSGGKTTLLRTIAHELATNAPVIITTTTRMFPFPDVPLCDGEDTEEIAACLSKNRLVSVGTVSEEMKQMPSSMSLKEMEKMAPYVIAECDGSKMLPLKAHRAFEPVVPEGCASVISVLGLSGIGKKVSEAAHCPELYAAIAGCSADDIVTPAMAAKVLVNEYAADKRFRFSILVLNQAESNEAIENACILARIVTDEIHVPVFCGSVRKGELICLS